MEAEGWTNRKRSANIGLTQQMEGMNTQGNMAPKFLLYVLIVAGSDESKRLTSVLG